MGGVACHRPGLHIGGEADLQRDAMIVDVFEQVDIFVQAGAVADAVRSAVMDCLVDGAGAEALPGVDGAVDVELENPLERLAVIAGRVISLFPARSNATTPRCL